MRVVSHHCQHICCGAAREAFMGFLGGSLVCHDGVSSSIAGMDRLENVTKTTFTARTRFRRPLYHSRQPFDGESGMAVAYGLWWSSLRQSGTRWSYAMPPGMLRAEGACARNNPGGGPRVREGRRESVPRFGRCFIGMRARTESPLIHTTRAGSTPRWDKI